MCETISFSTICTSALFNGKFKLQYLLVRIIVSCGLCDVWCHSYFYASAAVQSPTWFSQMMDAVIWDLWMNQWGNKSLPLVQSFSYSFWSLYSTLRELIGAYVFANAFCPHSVVYPMRCSVQTLSVVTYILILVIPKGSILKFMYVSYHLTTSVLWHFICPTFWKNVEIHLKIFFPPFYRWGRWSKLKGSPRVCKKAVV